MIVAQLSDPHLREDDDAPAAALARAVEAVLRLEPAPDLVLLTGDVANTPSAREYAQARELLAPLPMPVHWLPGNHDDPRVFPEPGALDAPGLRVVLCDTTVPGADGGRLDVGWLERTLAEAPERPTIVAMHHPPILLGLPEVDAIAIARADVEALGALLPRHPQVRRITTGHVHRGAFGVVGGCPVVTCPSTYLATRLELGAPTAALADEPPGFLVHALVDGEVVSHVQPVAVA